MPSKRKRWLLIAGLSIPGLCLGWAVFRLLFEASSGNTLTGAVTSNDPADCRTPLAQLSRCFKWDNSWTECRVVFRAEGVPEKALCERFLRVTEPVASTLPARAPSALPGQTPEPCTYTDERRWTRVDCKHVGLEANLACFYCQRSQHEAHNEYLQAFDPACERGIVLRSCNHSLQFAAQQGQ
ncbi:hypothetical protein [Archangium sp. Cb G35]|uniref:hypothetical protein n=1 Tax=Archangium sp. Cb G35 TaxID=1920190 RepID=UPI000A748663|nr:hypothetical protein [Archangium sp. Cb G35]